MCPTVLGIDWGRSRVSSGWRREEAGSGAGDRESVRVGIRGTTIKWLGSGAVEEGWEEISDPLGAIIEHKLAPSEYARAIVDFIRQRASMLPPDPDGLGLAVPSGIYREWSWIITQGLEEQRIAPLCVVLPRGRALAMWLLAESSLPLKEVKGTVFALACEALSNDEADLEILGMEVWAEQGLRLARVLREEEKKGVEVSKLAEHFGAFVKEVEKEKERLQVGVRGRVLGLVAGGDRLGFLETFVREHQPGISWWINPDNNVAVGAATAVWGELSGMPVWVLDEWLEVRCCDRSGQWNPLDPPIPVHTGQWSYAWDVGEGVHGVQVVHVVPEAELPSVVAEVDKVGRTVEVEVGPGWTVKLDERGGDRSYTIEPKSIESALQVGLVEPGWVYRGWVSEGGVFGITGQPAGVAVGLGEEKAVKFGTEGMDAVAADPESWYWVPNILRRFFAGDTVQVLGCNLSVNNVLFSLLKKPHVVVMSTGLPSAVWEAVETSGMRLVSLSTALLAAALLEPRLRDIATSLSSGEPVGMLYCGMTTVEAEVVQLGKGKTAYLVEAILGEQPDAPYSRVELDAGDLALSRSAFEEFGRQEMLGYAKTVDAARELLEGGAQWWEALEFAAQEGAADTGTIFRAVNAVRLGFAKVWESMSDTGVGKERVQLQRNGQVLAEFEIELSVKDVLERLREAVTKLRERAGERGMDVRHWLVSGPLVTLPGAQGYVGQDSCVVCLPEAPLAGAVGVVKALGSRRKV